MSTLTPHPSTLTNRHSLRLGLLILLVVGSVFGVSLGLMFYQTRKFVNQAAERRAMQELGETVAPAEDPFLKLYAIFDKMQGFTP